MNEPMTQTMVAIGVLALLLGLRRRRTGDQRRSQTDATDLDEARAADEAFHQFNSNDFV